MPYVTRHQEKTVKLFGGHLAERHNWTSASRVSMGKVNLQSVVLALDVHELAIPHYLCRASGGHGVDPNINTAPDFPAKELFEG